MLSPEVLNHILEIKTSNLELFIKLVKLKKKLIHLILKTTG